MSTRSGSPSTARPSTAAVRRWFSPQDLGSNVYSYQPGEMVLTVTGGFNISAGTATTGMFNTNTYQLSDDLSLVRGNHQLAFGANVAYWKMDFLTHARSGGDWNVNGQVTGLGLADFMLGRVARLEHGGPATCRCTCCTRALRAGHLESDRSGSRSMRVSAGSRSSGRSSRTPVYNFELENFRTNARSTVFVNAPAGFIYPGDPGFPSATPASSKQWLNFSPRVGLAWDVTGDGRMAVRSSYGIAYDFPTAERHNINTQSPPWGNRSLVENPPGGFDDPYGHLGGDPHPIVAAARCSSSRSARMARPIRTSTRRASSRGTSPSSGSSGRLGRRRQLSGQLHRSVVDADPAEPRRVPRTGPCTLNGVSFPVCSTAANVNQRRVLSLSGENPASAALIGNLDLHTSIGTQNYRGLRLSFRRRAATGISLNGNYTISRCFGDNTDRRVPAARAGADQSRRSRRRSRPLRPGPHAPGNLAVGSDAGSSATPRCARLRRTGASPASSMRDPAAGSPSPPASTARSTGSVSRSSASIRSATTCTARRR